MKIQFLKLKNWLFLSLVGLLGFNACSSTKKAPAVSDDKNESPRVAPRGEIALMYGVPTLNFVVKGKVVNADGKPVKGVQVVLLDNSVDATPDTIYGNPKFVESYLHEHASISDKDGNFSTKLSSFPSDSQRILVRDIDGTDNGSYQNQITNVSFDQSQRTGQQGNWSQGTVEKVITIQLKEK